MLFASHEIVNTFHAHYSASLVISLATGERAIRLENADEERALYDAVWIPPNFPHRLSAPKTDVLVFQLDPDMDDFRSVVAAGGDAPRELHLSEERVPDLKARVLALREDTSTCDAALDLCGTILERFLEGEGDPDSGHISRKASREADGAHPLEPRVREVLEHLRGLPEIPVDVNTEEMARLVGLSAERFRTLFREHMGLRFRRYLLWLRLRRAARILGDGASLTDAAHAAGFYDQAHFSRTFREMFGHAPSDLLGKPRTLRIHACEGDRRLRR